MKLTFQLASRINLVLFGLLILFHLAIIFGIVVFEFAPVDYLWGGRMQSARELLQFEFVSLIIASVCLITVLVRVQKIKVPSLLKASKVVLWVLAVIFALNTVGNILAKSTFEQMMTFVTLALAITSARMAMEPIDKK